MSSSSPASSAVRRRRPRQRAGPHSQLLAQPGTHLPPGDQHTGPVTGRGELPHQAGRRLVQRVQLAA
ncbi:MAG TPA: hypothetical protein VMK13_12860 [Streptosporangiaceae bacterium]|nr:hypothetical protein [Streptosporangiaceae bacterium]